MTNQNQIEETRIQAAYAKRAENDARYSWFNISHLFIIQERERRMLSMLNRCGVSQLTDKTILEIGCGTGFWLREFIKWGAQPKNLVGVDLLADHVAEAKRLCPEEVRIECRSATTLDIPNSSIDLVLQSTAFTSILDSGMRARIASEMLRVVKGDGLVLWYDYHVNNPWNSDVRGVKKQEIIELFPNCQIELERITFAPPFVRFLAPYSWLGCYLFERLKIFNTHYLGVIKKK